VFDIIDARCNYKDLIKKFSLPTKRKTVSLVTVKSRNALLRTLLERICSYPKAVLRYKFLILDTREPNIVYLCKQACEDPWLFFEAKRAPWAKFWEALL
jgi:hypothetical protein